MENTVVNALIPLGTAILAEGIQILAEVIRGHRWREVKWWRILSVTTAAAILATAIIYLIVSKATSCAVSNMGWMPYSNDGMGSTLTVNPVVGSECTFQVYFDLKQEGGYVAAYKKLEPKFLAWWIQGLEFSYSGIGQANTLEVKLFDAQDNQYKLVRQHVTNTGGRTETVTVPYAELTSAENGELFRRQGFVLDRLDITISSWDGDAPGMGNVVIRDIHLVLAWQIWLLIFSPVLVLGVLTLYLFWHRPLKPTRKMIARTRPI